MNRVLNLQIPKKLSDELDKEKEKTGVPKSEIVRRAIKKYLIRRPHND